LSSKSGFFEGLLDLSTEENQQKYLSLGYATCGLLDTKSLEDLKGVIKTQNKYIFLIILSLPTFYIESCIHELA